LSGFSGRLNDSVSLVSFRYRPPKDPNVYSPSGTGPFSSDAFQPCVKTPLINLVDAGVAAVSKPASCPSATLNLSGFGPTSSYSVSLSASPSFSIVASAIAVVVVVVVSEDDAFSEFSSTSSFVSPEELITFAKRATTIPSRASFLRVFALLVFVLRRGPTTKEAYAVFSFFFVVFPETTPWCRPGDDDDDAVASVKDIIFLLLLLLLFLLLLLLLEKSADIFNTSNTFKNACVPCLGTHNV
jgi:hypothetical protein